MRSRVPAPTPGAVARKVITKVLVVAGLAAWTATPLSAAPDDARPAGTEPSSGERFVERMGGYFEAHPELQTTRSSGWKPYSRAKHGLERSRTNGVVPSSRDRWEAWERKREMAARSGAPAAAWFEIGPVNLTGRILAIAFHPSNPDIVYVGAASGGLWKSTDGGDTWTPVTDELPTLGIGGVAVDPFDPDIVVIGTGEATPNSDALGGVGILRSTDAGATWNTTNVTIPVDTGHGFHCIEVHPVTGVFLAGSNSGLWRSSDAGASWTMVDGSGQDVFDVKWKPGDSSRVYSARGGAFGGTTLRVSTNGGVTWANLSGSGYPSSSGNSKTKIAVTADQPAWIYAHVVSTSGYGTRGVYRSTNDGANWTTRNSSLNMTGGQGWYNNTIAVDPNDATRVIAGGVELYGSSDGGSSFAEVGDGYGLGTDTAVHWDHHAIAYEPGSNSTLWVGCDGGVWRSTDDGANWLSRREGIGTYQFYDICVSQSDPGVTLGGAQDNGVPGRVGVDDWFTSNLFADGFVCNIHPTDELKIHAEWQGGNHVKSTDGGLTWRDLQDGISGGGDWLTPVAMDRNQANHLFTESSGGIWWRGPGGGIVWHQRGTHSARWIDISRVDGNVVWTINGGTARPYLTTDDGLNWSQVSNYGFSVGSSTKVLAHPTDVQTALVTFSGYSAANVAITTDMGASWTDVTGDLPHQPVNAIAIDPQFPDDWYIGTDVGVWTSTNGGANWTPFDTGLPNAVVSDLEIRESARKLVAGTYGRGAWEIQIAGATVASPEVAGAAPWNLMLDPPAPNPMTDRAVLRFAARSDAPVELSIFDVAGRRITNLADFSSGDGRIRNVSWYPDDVAAGVYFAVLRAGEARITRKVVVTR
ncbi:T9SS type A sorting domain-containing protein [bacterium]|nr:T9SS type A sorting domain-containing protein [bacterium]